MPDKALPFNLFTAAANLFVSECLYKREAGMAKAGREVIFSWYFCGVLAGSAQLEALYRPEPHRAGLRMSGIVHQDRQ
jgi:hypothetical protein